MNEKQKSLNVLYPCCSGRARFLYVDLVPVEKYERRCKTCGKVWTITRTTLKTFSDGTRIDKLEWEKSNG